MREVERSQQRVALVGLEMKSPAVTSSVSPITEVVHDGTKRSRKKGEGNHPWASPMRRCTGRSSMTAIATDRRILHGPPTDASQKSLKMRNLSCVRQGNEGRTSTRQARFS